MGIEAALMGVQMLTKLTGQRQQYKQQQRMYEAQAQAAQQNAAIISKQREQQAEAYAQKQKQLNDRFRLARGQARAEAGASGLTADGSVADILSSSEDAYKQDSINLLQKQRNDSWNSYVNEVNYRNQANAYNNAASNARKQGHQKMFATLIGDSANIYSKGMDKGWFGSKETSWADANSSLGLPTSNNIQGYNLYNQAKKNNPYLNFNGNLFTTGY
jgi:hypothetical protein